MGSWRSAMWDRRLAGGVARRDRATGAYQWFKPTPLAEFVVTLPTGMDRQVARAERAVRTLTTNPAHADLAGVARFLLRSEAIASSRIEGLTPAPRQIAFAELAGEDDQVTTFSAQAQLVARNMTVVRTATTDLALAEDVKAEAVIALHASLLTGRPDEHGLRAVQNWIGGSDYHPIGADFVPPVPQLVPELMDDLLAYLNGAQHSPLVQAALVHAQFETIHPFTDRNGRVGRALIHTVLSRRGLTPTAVLPVSLVLETFRDEYIRGLTAFRRYDPTEPASADALHEWIGAFLVAVERAAEQAQILARELTDLRARWIEQLDELHRVRGRVRAMRADSTTAHILAQLPATPVLTVKTASRVHGASTGAATKSLGELVEAGVLTRRKAGRTSAYVADELLDLVNVTERRLASTRFDTRISPPHGGVPASPPGHPGLNRWMHAYLA